MRRQPIESRPALRDSPAPCSDRATRLPAGQDKRTAGYDYHPEEFFQGVTVTCSARNRSAIQLRLGCPGMINLSESCVFRCIPPA